MWHLVPMRRVILESPFKGPAVGGWAVGPVEAWWQRWRNRIYARKCLHDSLMRGEAPFASHLLYPQVLHDSWNEERDIGIQAGLAWLEVCDASVVYTDRGISEGMREGILAAEQLGIGIEYRSLFDPPRETGP